MHFRTYLCYFFCRYQQISKPSSKYEDKFVFFLSDGLHNSSNAVFVIKLIDYGKRILNVLAEECIVKYGGEAVLNSSILFASDNSSRVEDILFSITKPPIYGNLLLNGNTSLYFDNFTLFDIMNNQLSYNHNQSFRVYNDSFDLMVTNGVVVKNLTFDISIASLNNIPILEKMSPLHLNTYDINSYVISSEHLLAHKPPLSNKIIYLIKEQPKFGSLMYDQNSSHPASFTQDDIDNGLISYLPYKNSTTDAFSFKLSNNVEDGYLYNGNLLFKPTVYV